MGWIILDRSMGNQNSHYWGDGEKMTSLKRRDDFSKGVRDVLANRAGYRCSKPDCRAATAGPGADEEKKGSIGIAAHITAAAEGGPRYDPKLSSDERASVANGIWLCDTHARLIDNDVDAYPAQLSSVRCFLPCI